MRLLLFIFVTLSLDAFSCERKFLVNAEAKGTFNSEAVTIIIEAPAVYEDFRLGIATYNKGENRIPMYQGYKESDVVTYELRGTKDFFIGAIVNVTYLGTNSLCAYDEKIDLESVIKNCSDCENDT